MTKAGSWGRLPRAAQARLLRHVSRHQPLPQSESLLLAHGNGRSYGDVCLNDGHALLLTRDLDRFIAFDPATGGLRCEAGVLLGEIIDLVMPQGWFLPVVPGTRFVTVGGAIANDIHGKNHHRAGSFGHHVRRLELVRSDGNRIECGPAEASGWFEATVGGLGLTGLITWAELQLERVQGPWMVTEARRFARLNDFWPMNAEAERRWPYTVAWIDCVGPRRGRGILFGGRHAPALAQGRPWRDRGLAMPFDPPFSLVNGASLRAFNTLYYHRPQLASPGVQHCMPFFFPLDGMRHWNRIYGQRGFYQYQCVVPRESAPEAIAELIDRIGQSGEGSFLAVLKTFGDRPAAGLLSFPRAGATLALDFPNRGARTEALFRELDAVVREAGGALYPAKDARMPPDVFHSGFPRLERFLKYVDPRFSSNFWRRIQA